MCTHRSILDISRLHDVFHELDVLVVEEGLTLVKFQRTKVPEVSTMVVVRLLFIPGGMVITGTIVWMFEMKVSFTSEVISLKVSE
jgi:hypothetical protein